MARPLLSVAALFVTTAAAASPPVDTQRVTGNVSTEHSSHPLVAMPVVDSCRVTGNLMPPRQKSAATCRIASAEVSLDLVEVDGQTCEATGTVAIVETGPMCRIGSEDDYVDLPILPIPGV